MRNIHFHHFHLQPVLKKLLNNPDLLTMGRNKKTRICKTGSCLDAFKPTGIPLGQLPQVIFLPEELEVIRLCDLTNLTQAQAGEQMGVSRGTIQRILTAARKKIASALVNGEALIFNQED